MSILPLVKDPGGINGKGFVLEPECARARDTVSISSFPGKKRRGMIIRRIKTQLFFPLSRLDISGCRPNFDVGRYIYNFKYGII